MSRCRMIGFTSVSVDHGGYVQGGGKRVDAIDLS